MAISERKKQPFKVLHRIALEKAREIHESPIEKLYSIDEYGDCYYAEGDAEEVQPTQTMIERGVIDVHNHPHNLKIPSSFSGDDVFNLLSNPHKKEIIVSGYGIYFWMRRGTCTQAPADVSQYIDNMSSEISDTLFKKLPIHTTKKKQWRKEFAIYQKNVEIAYHKELVKYTKQIGLSYGKGNL